MKKQKPNTGLSSYIQTEIGHDMLYLGSEEMLALGKMIKENYVLTHHSQDIFFMEKRNRWKTYVGTPRKGVERKDRGDLIEFLYQFYKAGENANNTLGEVFERCEEYRRNALNRAQSTIKRDGEVFYRFFEKSFYTRPIKGISADEIAEYFCHRSKELEMSERALKDSKQVLDRTFRYAIQQEKILTANPVQIDLENYYQNCIQEIKTDDDKIFTLEEIAEIEAEIRSRLNIEGYDAKLYAMLISIHTGVRAGELPTLRWSDVTDKGLHIHTQQRIFKEKGKPKILEELPFTKNERRHPKGGRYFPISDSIQSILDEIKAKQDRLGISSEFIFCEENGAWLDKEMYQQRLRRLCKKLGFNITNNHAFRKSLNSNVLIPLGIPVTQRAYLLGHSVEVNERNYSFTRTEELEKVKNKLNEANHSKSLKNVVSFPKKEIPQAQ